MQEPSVYITRMRWAYVLAIALTWSITAFAHRPVPTRREADFQVVLGTSMLLALAWSLLRPDFPRTLLFGAPFFGGQEQEANRAGRSFCWLDLLLAGALMLAVALAVYAPPIT